MPGLITHYICGEAVLRELSQEQRQLLESRRAMYNVGTQGPDIYFYYYPGLLQKKIFGLGNKMHEDKFFDFVIKLINCIKCMPVEHRAGLISYLCGYLTHYALDYNAHPYIYYHSGFKRRGEKGSRLKYSVNHRNFETAIDVMILKLLSNEKPADKKLWQMIVAGRQESQLLSRILSRIINKTYDVPINEYQVYNSMRLMVLTTRVLQSKTGKRKKFVEFVENMTIGENSLSSVIHLQEIKDGIDYLNLKQSNWCMPWDNKTTYNHRFIDMYNKSVEDSIIMIKSVFDYMDGVISKDQLREIIGNRSLTSGIDAEQKVVFKYHDIVFKRRMVQG